MVKEIKKISLKHFGEKPSEIAPLKGGEMTNVFLIAFNKERYVIKFNELYEDRSILKMEMTIMDSLTEIKINTPKPVFYGIVPGADNIKASSQEYLIMTHLEGELLSSVWPTYNDINKNNTIEKLLDMLNRISIRTTGFGPINENLEGEWSTFSEYFQSEIKKFTNSEVLEKVDKNIWENVLNTLSAYAKDKANFKPSFVHADFRLRNIMVCKNDLFLFDFGNAMSMDPVFDFVRFLKIDFSEGDINSESARYIKKEFLNKYYSGEDYDYDEEIYRLLLTLRLSPWYYSVGKQERLKQTLQEMSELVNTP